MQACADVRSPEGWFPPHCAPDPSSVSSNSPYCQVALAKFVIVSDYGHFMRGTLERWERYIALHIRLYIIITFDISSSKVLYFVLIEIRGCYWNIKLYRQALDRVDGEIN